MPTAKVIFKGGSGSGWYAPPKGTHSGAAHEKAGSGKSGPGYGGGTSARGTGLAGEKKTYIPKNKAPEGKREPGGRTVPGSAEAERGDIAMRMFGGGKVSTRGHRAKDAKAAASEFHAKAKELIDKHDKYGSAAFSYDDVRELKNLAGKFNDAASIAHVRRQIVRATESGRLDRSEMYRAKRMLRSAERVQGAISRLEHHVDMIRAGRRGELYESVHDALFQLENIDDDIAVLDLL